MNIKALTLEIEFQTAQFKMHHLILSRRTYLIPPPSAVAGFFCAILGVHRKEMKKFCVDKKILAGAELRGLKGVFTSVSRIFKFDCGLEEVITRLEEWTLHKPRSRKNRTLADVYKDIVGMTPLKESEELFEPKYKFGIAGEQGTIEKILERLQSLDFEYDIFGGNDYHFIKTVGEVKRAELVKSTRGAGYCPVDQLRCFELQKDKSPIITFAPVGKKLKTFVFCYGITILAKDEIDAVRDAESTIFVYNPTEYLPEKLSYGS
jgi:CRISPR-associated Cas5-like protein